MASPETRQSLGAESMIPSGRALAFTAMALVFLLFKRLLWQTFDPREPPVFRPKVPFVGHIVSLVREASGYYHRLYKERPTPIFTLPVLNGKIYIINSPSLISAAMRSKDLSFDPLLLEFSVAVGALSKRQLGLVSVDGALDRIHRTMTAALTSTSLTLSAQNALNDLEGVLNRVRPDDELVIPELFFWLREVMSKATMKGLYGSSNPVDDAALQNLWDFEEYFGVLVLGMTPSILTRKPVQARRKLQTLFGKYYAARHDELPDVSALVQKRASLHRELGYTDRELGVSEYLLPLISTTNTIPSLTWLFTSIFSRPDLVARLRPELAAITALTAATTPGGATRTATLYARFEKTCPLLMACYHEALRLYNDNTGNRRVMRDTVLSDAAAGREYVLTRGAQVQWVSGIAQTSAAIWGPDARAFRPERWLGGEAGTAARRQAMVPFGGGRNLCPGRGFALVENLALVGALVLGFEVEGVRVPEARTPLLGGAMKVPSWEGMEPGARIRRRVGWEDVTWVLRVA